MLKTKKRVTNVLLIFIFFILFSNNAEAIRFKRNKVKNNPKYDEQLFHYGFLLGLTMLDFTLKTSQNMGVYGDTLLSINHHMQPGFSVGIVSNLRLGKFFDLRFIPTFSLAQRDLVYRLKNGEGGIDSETKTMESIFIELPLEIKWKAARLVNSRPYVIVGVKYTADLAALKKRKQEHDDVYEMKLNKHDVGISVGVGWDFYLPYNNKIALELKFFMGFMDLLVRENNLYTNSIDRLTSKMFQFNITFE